MHYRSLERVKIAALKRNHGNFETWCSIDQSCIDDLLWWQENLPNAMAPIARGAPSASFSVDASGHGWGAVYGNHTANGHFSLFERTYTSNTKETLAVLYGLWSFAHFFPQSHVLILSDSQTTIANVSKMGSMDCLLRNRIVKQIWEFAMSKGIWISMTFLPGKFNVASDIESRELNCNIQWCLPQLVFDALHHRFRSFGFVVVDLHDSPSKQNVILVGHLICSLNKLMRL